MASMDSSDIDAAGGSGTEGKIEVTAAAIIRNGSLLIAQRKRGDPHELLWELPGGKREAEESLEECLRRELGEEMGIDAEIGRLIGTAVKDDGHLAVEIFAFHVPAFRGKIAVRAHETVRWVEPQEFQNYDFLDADQLLIRRIAEKWESLTRG
jgi:8-oxo-dGTP diphosphatase